MPGIEKVEPVVLLHRRTLEAAAGSAGARGSREKGGRPEQARSRSRRRSPNVSARSARWRSTRNGNLAAATSTGGMTRQTLGPHRRRAGDRRRHLRREPQRGGLVHRLGRAVHPPQRGAHGGGAGGIRRHGRAGGGRQGDPPGAAGGRRRPDRGRQRRLDRPRVQLRRNVPAAPPTRPAASTWPSGSRRERRRARKPPGRGDQPLPAAAQEQSGRLVRLGAGSAREAPAARTSRFSSRWATPPATGAT